MRDLWKGLALLAFDEEVRDAVAREAKFRKPERDLESGVKDHPLFKDLQLNNQPDINALRGIDKILRGRGLHASPYALAELNRWMAPRAPDFKNKLDKFREAIEQSFSVGSKIQSPGFLEAIGALISDEIFRDQFAEKGLSLRERGFIISAAEEEALLEDFRKDKVKAAAQAIFRHGWSGGSCQSNCEVRDGSTHNNC